MIFSDSHFWRCETIQRTDAPTSGALPSNVLSEPLLPSGLTLFLPQIDDAHRSSRAAEHRKNFRKTKRPLRTISRPDPFPSRTFRPPPSDPPRFSRRPLALPSILELEGSMEDRGITSHALARRLATLKRPIAPSARNPTTASKSSSNPPNTPSRRNSSSLPTATQTANAACGSP